MSPSSTSGAFAAKAGKSWQVRVLNRATGDGGLRSVRDAFKRRDRNTIIGADGEPDFGVERLLADRIDSPAAPAIAKLREGTFPLDAEEEIALALFMAAQLVRGREVRENLADTMGKVNRQAVMLAAQHYSDERWEDMLGFLPSKTQLRQLAGGKDAAVPPSTAMLLQGLFSSVNEMADLLARRTWTLVTFGEPCLFTGEHPFVHVTAARGGYGVATAERFHLPISPTRSLVLSHPWTHWPEGKARGSRGLAVRLNWATFIHPANKELLMHPEVEWHPLPAIALLDRGG